MIFSKIEKEIANEGKRFSEKENKKNKLWKSWIATIKKENEEENDIFGNTIFILGPIP